MRRRWLLQSNSQDLTVKNTAIYVNHKDGTGDLTAPQLLFPLFMQFSVLGFFRKLLYHQDNWKGL